MIICSDLVDVLEKGDLGRDRLGTIHDGEPGEARVGQALYGSLGRPAYACGCQPAIHRFRCAACKRVFGWCYGGASMSDSESECCNTCVVALWRSADRFGIDHDRLARALDRDPVLRAEVYAALHRIFGGAS
jgi:hypothetical protein